MSTAESSGAPIVFSFGDVVSRTWNTYTTGSAGGFLLSQELAGSVWDKARAIDGPLARCRIVPVTQNSLRIPAFNESSRAAGSRWGGVTAIWEGKDDGQMAGNASNPALATLEIRPNRIYVLAAQSNDLLADAPALNATLDYAASQEIAYSLTEAMIVGLGIKGPLGVINAPSTIRVSRAGSNAVATADIDTMWSRLWPYCRRNAVWMCNDDTLLKVDQAATTGGWPSNLYMPQGMFGNPFPLLKGRPLLPVEPCPSLGATGDLIVGDWSQYCLGVRSDVSGYPDIEGSIERMASSHLYFDTDQTVFRFKLRVDGKPIWTQPVTIADGSQTAGPFVVLQ